MLLPLTALTVILFMPLIPKSTYQPHWWLKNPHLQTIYPTIFRPGPKVNYHRERIQTPDRDFLDIDWVKQGSNDLVIALHGLEGSSRSKYIPGMLKAFFNQGWDGLGVNFRGCSGQPNLQPRAYHSGETGDLQLVLDHITTSWNYTRIVLVGFSLGGNVVLKYLGEKGREIHPLISHAVTFSVPVDLSASSTRLDQRENFIYLQRFMRRLRKKVRLKIHQLPAGMNPDNLKNFRQFDDAITAPLHGFRDAEDYYQRSSSKQFLPNIRVPTLLVNALNDPFLTPECFPYAAAAKSKYFFLETPFHGGHVGFTRINRQNLFWSEKRAFAFVGENLRIN